MAIGPGGGADDPTEQDPLFYRGKSPVLGQDISVRTAGQAPGEFPQAGPGLPSGPQAPMAPRFGAPPTRPDFGDVPQFQGDFPGLDFGEPPTPPSGKFPSLNMPTQPQPSWWQGALAGLDVLGKGYGDVKSLMAQQGQNVPPMPGWVAPTEASNFSLFGGEPGPWYQGAGPGFNLGLDTQFATGLPGEAGAEAGAVPTGVLNPADYSLGVNTQLTTGLPGQAAAAGGAPGLGIQSIFPGVQAAGGLYGAITGKPGSPSQVASAANAAGGLAALGAQMGWLPGAAMGLGPALGLASLPAILGPIIARFTRHDSPRWPKNYKPLQTTQGDYAVDPATGAVLQYHGHGRYDWSDFTKGGQRLSPQQFKEYRVDPTGELAKLPDYAGVAKENRIADIKRATETGGAEPATQQHVQEQAAEEMQPTIGKLQAAHPGLSQGQIWQLYATDPANQAELQRIEQEKLSWRPPQYGGGD